MQKVPEVLTTKDLSYIADIFNWNITATKKLFYFKEEVLDKDLIQKFNELYSMHKSICESLVKILESGVKNAG